MTRRSSSTRLFPFPRAQRTCYYICQRERGEHTPSPDGKDVIRLGSRMRKQTIYVIDNFDYEGRMDEDAYEDAIAAVESRRVVDEGNAIAGLAWDLQVASKRYERCPCESLAAIVRALYCALQEVMQ